MCHVGVDGGFQGCPKLRAQIRVAKASRWRNLGAVSGFEVDALSQGPGIFGTFRGQGCGVEPSTLAR